MLSGSLKDSSNAFAEIHSSFAALVPQELFSSNTHLYNLYSQTGYAPKKTNVDNVMVNERFIVRDRGMLTLDQKGVLARAEESATKVRASVGYSFP